MRQLLIATTNQHKIREIRDILGQVPVEICTLADWPSVSAPDETGSTFAENAREKAVYYARTTGMLTVAEDSGLEIDALDGLPGLQSARYGGVDTSYPEKFARIYATLRAARSEGSPARFVCALTLAHPNRILFETTGTIEGRIAERPMGDGGFGYDPIFYYPPFASTLAEAGARKSAVSHRSRAVRRLKTFLLSGLESEFLNLES
jgi:XTP/dITP diphosphohydrolase